MRDVCQFKATLCKERFRSCWFQTQRTCSFLLSYSLITKIGGGGRIKIIPIKRGLPHTLHKTLKFVSIFALSTLIYLNKIITKNLTKKAWSESAWADGLWSGFLRKHKCKRDTSAFDKKSTKKKKITWEKKSWTRKLIHWNWIWEDLLFFFN